MTRSVAMLILRRQAMRVLILFAVALAATLLRDLVDPRWRDWIILFQGFAMGGISGHWVYQDRFEGLTEDIARAIARNKEAIDRAERALAKARSWGSP